jgi:N-carbamoylputrescine amidase
MSALSNSNPILRIGLIQMACSEHPRANLNKAISSIKEAANQGAHIICLQELFRSRYFCQEENVAFFDLAESIPGPTTKRMSQLANELKVELIVPIFEKRAEGIYHNTAVVIDRKGEISGLYRKMHIPDDPFYYEKFYFTPGDLGFRVHNLTGARIAVLICWDQWFPEAARLVTLQGAQVIFYPTAIGWLDDQPPEVSEAQHAAWETVQRAHAIANGSFVASANRVGREGSLTFWGQSFVCDPFGRLLAKASSEQEEILVVPCDLHKVEKIRREWCFLRDRRVDAYTNLARLYLDEET